jgi:hypothetical protein
MGTAWERHGMCESALSEPETYTGCSALEEEGEEEEEEEKKKTQWQVFTRVTRVGIVGHVLCVS